MVSAVSFRVSCFHSYYTDWQSFACLVVWRFLWGRGTVERGGEGITVGRKLPDSHPPPTRSAGFVVIATSKKHAICTRLHAGECSALWHLFHNTRRRDLTWFYFNKHGDGLQVCQTDMHRGVWVLKECYATALYQISFNATQNLTSSTKLINITSIIPANQNTQLH